MEGFTIVYLKQVVLIPWIYFGIALVLVLVIGITFRRLIAGLLAGYYFLTVVFTIIIRTAGDTEKIELIPFWSYVAYFKDPGNGVLTQIIANVILFIPIGIMLGILTRRIKPSILIGFILSFAIEFLQLITHRGLFEIDDIIHNTVGVVLGCLTYTLPRKKQKRYHR